MMACRLVAELPATGGVVPSWKISTVKLLRYVSPSDYFVLACEIMFMLFIVYYIIEEAIEVCLHCHFVILDMHTFISITALTVIS